MAKNKYLYLCTPYSKFPEGLERAEQMAAYWSEKLLACGIPIFCPIIHGHRIHEQGNIVENPLLYLELDRPFVERSGGLIIIQEKTWSESSGIQQEIKWITPLRKPIYMINVENPEPTIVQILIDFPTNLISKNILTKRRYNALSLLNQYIKGNLNKDLCWMLIYDPSKLSFE